MEQVFAPHNQIRFKVQVVTQGGYLVGSNAIAPQGSQVLFLQQTGSVTSVTDLWTLVPDITGSAIPTISAESSFNRRKTRVTTGSGDSPRACLT